MTTTTTITFEADPAWAEDLRAMTCDPEVLARWWAVREARLAEATVTLTDPAREALALELAEVVTGPIPQVVRVVPLDRAHEQLRRLRGLVVLNAPAIVVANVRDQLLRHASQLDPASPWRAEPAPPVSDPRTWLEAMLRAGQANAPRLDAAPPLPHRIDVGGAPVMLESGGPVYLGLAETRAIVSFAWTEDDAAGPWRTI